MSVLSSFFLNILPNIFRFRGDVISSGMGVGTVG